MLFTFPSRYWFTIGRQGVFSLGRWSSLLPTGFHVSRGTQDHPQATSLFAYRTFTFYAGPFQTSSTKPPKPLWGPTTPVPKRLVWALPRSLAATQGIDVSFFSSGYLDVSVPRVPSSYLCIQYMDDVGITPAGFPHSDISRINACLRLPEAFRSFHVLLRLLAPRHPPYALSSLTLVTEIVILTTSFASSCFRLCSFQRDNT